MHEVTFVIGNLIVIDKSDQPKRMGLCSTSREITMGIFELNKKLRQPIFTISCRFLLSNKG